MQKKPNIVLIMTDQQRFDTISALGCAYMQTPNLDKLVENGVSYTNAFCCGATSVAARAALFTGMYPHNTGVYSFNNWSHHASWVRDLAEINYHCVNIGKMHISPIFENIGFHERRIIENKSQKFSMFGLPEDEWGWHLRMHGYERENQRHKTDPLWSEKRNAIIWDKAENLHSDIFCGNTATAWIKSYKWNKPLFLQIGFPGPHEPYDPPSRFIDMYEDKDIPAPVGQSEDLSNKPPQHLAFREYFKQTRNDESQIDLCHIADAELIRVRKHYYANITLIDEKIGEIVKTIEESGQLDNTVIIFTSDHGDNLGDHGLPYKWLMYDSITKIPLIIADFRKNTGHGEIESGLVSHIDLGPTVLDMAGVNAIPSRLEGKSLFQKDFNEEEPVFCEDNYLIMMREKKFKIVYYIGQETEGELYDLSLDPAELDNQWHNEEYVEKKNTMLLKIFKWLAMSNYRNTRYKTNQEGKGDCLRLPDSAEHGFYLHGKKSYLSDSVN